MASGDTTVFCSLLSMDVNDKFTLFHCAHYIKWSSDVSFTNLQDDKQLVLVLSNRFYLTDIATVN